MKFLFILIWLSLYLDASYINMQQYAKKGMHHKVLQEAKKSFSEYQNPKLHLLWAQSAEKLGKTTEAMAAYERVLILDPENKTAQKALQHIYTQTNRENLTLNPENDTKESSFKTKASLKFGYDTNININAGGDLLDGYYGVELGLDQISTYFSAMTANFLYLYHFRENPNWFLQGTLDLFYQNNFNAHKYDLTIPTANLTLGYLEGDNLFYIPVNYNNIHYLEKNLLNILTIKPRFRTTVIENYLWDIAVLYEKRNYIQTEDKAKDATSYGIESGIYYSFKNTQASLNVKYENRKADTQEIERYIDAQFFTLNTQMKYYFDNDIYAHFNYLFRYADYDDNIGTRETPSQISRDDYINELTLKISYILNKQTEVYIEDIYTKSLSTYIPAEYHKNIISLGLQMRF